MIDNSNQSKSDVKIVQKNFFNIVKIFDHWDFFCKLKKNEGGDSVTQLLLGKAGG